jgi:hypothetical protein
MKGRLHLPVLVAALLGAPAARADDADMAAAQGLFDDAKELVKQGRLAEACPKFLASFKFDPKPGTGVNLADCYEKNGQLASAWARYLEASSLAQRAGQAERQQYAKERAAALEPKISRLRITSPSASRGLEVLRDGAPVDVTLLGTALPVDPGKHQIEARAPGKKPWSRLVDIGVGAGQVAVEIPPLEDAPGGVPGEPPPAAGPAASAFPRKTLGLAAVGVGGAGLIVGAITGGLAIGKHGSLVSACDKQAVCVNQDAAIASYHLLGTVADVGLVVGGALAVTGIVLTATAPKAGAAKQAWVAPIIGPGFAGARGRF